MKRIIVSLAAFAAAATPILVEQSAARAGEARRAAPVAVIAPTPARAGFDRIERPRIVRPATRAPVVAPVRSWSPPEQGDVIEISLSKQRLTLWHDGAPEMRLVISTGMKGYETPTGRYRIRAKVRNGFSRKWGVVMPWAMQWNGNYMIHQITHYPGSPNELIGRADLGTPASHGCIRVDVGDAERLYKRVRLGTPVWVH